MGSENSLALEKGSSSELGEKNNSSSAEGVSSDLGTAPETKAKSSIYNFATYGGTRFAVFMLATGGDDEMAKTVIERSVQQGIYPSMSNLYAIIGDLNRAKEKAAAAASAQQAR